MSDNGEELLARALQRCASEQIHLAGAIQGRGVFLAFDTAGIIRMASDNLQTVFERSAQDSLECPVAHLLEKDVPADLLTYLRDEEAGASVQLNLCTTGRHKRALSATAHRVGELIVLELETEGDATPQDAKATISSIRSSLRQGDQHANVETYCQYVADALRALTNFDRVKVYRFDSYWNGDVIAESRNNALPALLHHHFPASDIPPQARALYEKNLIRILFDADAPTVPVVPTLNPQTGLPIDMSYSVLRAISPIHIEYLRNMGVRSTVTFSLMHDGRLWGLVACHSALPRPVSSSLREAIEVIGKTMAIKISALEYSRRLQATNDIREQLQRLTNKLHVDGDFDSVVHEFQSEFLELAGACGGYVRIEDYEIRLGNVPAQEHLKAIADWVKQQNFSNGIYVTDRLGSLYPPAPTFFDRASGLLAVALDKESRDFILWFRPEVLRNIRWAGNPYGRVTTDALGPRINPHRSFAVWLETARGYSEPWLDTTIDAVKLFSLSVLQLLMQQMRQQAMVATAANKTKSDFISSMNHELRTPLNAILGFSQLIKMDSTLTKDNLEYAEGIFKAGHHLLHLVNDVLSLASIEAGRMDISLESVELMPNLAECLSIVSILAKQRGISITHSILKDSAVTADPIRLKQIVINLLSNAIKYNREGGGVMLDVKATTTGRLQIRVTDTGRGIAAEFVKDLFQPFSRLGAENGPIEGAGIGLAITRRIAEMMGGKVGVESEVGVGSTFWIELPAAAIH